MFGVFDVLHFLASSAEEYIFGDLLMASDDGTLHQPSTRHLDSVGNTSRFDLSMARCADDVHFRVPFTFHTTPVVSNVKGTWKCRPLLDVLKKAASQSMYTSQHRLASSHTMANIHKQNADCVWRDAGADFF